MAESSIAVAVRIRPFSEKEAAQLAPQETFQPFLGDGGLSSASPSRMGVASGSMAPSLRTKFLRPIISPVDDKVLIFDPPDTNPLSRLYSAGQNTFGHGNKKAKDVRYAFDRVFDAKCGQEMVFENTTKPLLDGILNGYNASVFAYGATGCGKTHTISGTPDDPGVIFLTMKELYERIETSREESDVQVRLSYLEIYNESIRDLLSPLPTPPGQGLMLREDAAKKMSVVGITEHIPESPERVLEMIQEGNLRRTMSPTEANAVSSRSHAVLQINVTQRPRTANTITETTSASLNIIDLAGSERAAATRNNGARMKEGANINKSLLALGNCINALCQSGGQRSKHVPYRNSKLTRLLKFSLGGNCKTVMIVCVSPSSAHYDETHNTLKYANQAKNIRTKVSRNMLNVDRHVAQYVQAIHELREEVAELKSKLAERGTLESVAEKRRKVEMAKEVQETKAKMTSSTEMVKQLVQEKASVEALMAAAGVRVVSLRQRLYHVELVQSQQGSSKDLESEQDILQRMVAKEEGILQDKNLLSTIQSLNNSLQIQRGNLVAASQNTKFDVEAAESIRNLGECLLAEVEMVRSNVKYESLKKAFEMESSNLPELVTMGTQSTIALKEAASILQIHTQGQSSTPLSDLALQLHMASNGNDELFSRMVGTRTATVLDGESNALRRAAAGRGKLTATAAPTAPLPPKYSVQQHRKRTSVAGTSNKALLPITSPRKAMLIRRSTSGPRRSLNKIGNQGRRYSSNAATSAPKKSFRWADEAGEGQIDDHNRRSASPPLVRVSVPSGRAVSQSSKWMDRLSSTIRREQEAEVGQSSGTEWEDVNKEELVGGAVVAAARQRDGGRLFQRDYLVKGEEGGKVSSKLGLEDEDLESSLSDAVRAPFSELSNGVSESSSSGGISSEDYVGKGKGVEYSPVSVRSSPYSRRTSQLGPIRRKAARSSIGDANGGTQVGPSTHPRLATGPPLFTASRSGRASNVGVVGAATDHNRRSTTTTSIASGSTSQVKATPSTPNGIPSSSLTQSHTRITPTSSIIHRASSSGTAWR